MNADERRVHRMRDDQDELAERIAGLLPADGRREIQPGLHLNRASSPGETTFTVLETEWEPIRALEERLQD